MDITELTVHELKQKLENKELTAEEITKAYVERIESKEKESEVNNIITQYIEYLALGLSNLIRILEPDVIGIGGSFVYYESILMDRLKEKLQENFTNRKIPKLLTAKYGNDAGIIGAAMLKSN